MQGNDIATHYGKHNVIILESVLYKEPPETPSRRLGRWAKRVVRDWDRIAEEWELNDSMCGWIAWHGREFSVPTCIWSFLPSELYERLIPPVERICGDYIIEWDNFADTHEAYVRLRSNPHILSVFDGDRDRIELLWHMRGHYIEQGTTP